MATPAVPVSAAPPATQAVTGTVMVEPGVSPLATSDAFLARLIEHAMPAGIALGINGEDSVQVHKWGRTNAGTVGTSFVSVCQGTEAALAQPVYVSSPNAQYVHVSSTSAADAAAGTGLRTATLYGIDDTTMDYVSETIVLDGVTPVQSSKRYYVVYRWVPRTTGSSFAQAGTISVTDSGGSVVYMRVYADPARSQFAYFPIAPGYIAILTDHRISLNSGKAGVGRIRMRTWEADYSTRSPWQTLVEVTVPADESFMDDPRTFQAVAGPAEIVVEAKVDSAPAGQAFARFGIVAYKAPA